MNIKDFEKNISSKLLDKGYDYFLDNRINGLDEVSVGLWIAEVYGTEKYTVTIQIQKSEINEWECNCPYDYGPICKHVVAVLYAIAENIKPVIGKNTKKKAVGKKRKRNVEEIFGKTSKEDLQKFIVTQFRKDSSLKNAFIAFFAELLDEDQNQKYTTIVHNIYKAAQGQYGFIDYHSARGLTISLHELEQKAEEYVNNGKITEGLAICKTLIEEVPDFIGNMDDSSGGAGDVVDYAFDILYQIIDNAPPLLKDELFEYCLNEYEKEKYHKFDFDENFLSIIPELVTTEDQENKFFKIINQQIESEKKGPYPEYSITQLIKTKVLYLQKNKREKEAWELIEQNIEYPDFREMVINQAIEKLDYQKAKELCLIGIEIANKEGNYGTLNKWKQIMLNIADNEQNVSDIRKWSRTLFFENYFDMNYYKKLKATYTKEEWTDRCEEIINKIKGKDQRGSYDNLNSLAQVFVEENYKSRLLKLLQLNSKEIFFIDKYSKHLKKKYPSEMLVLYENGIKELAQTKGRDNYNKVAKLLKKLKQIQGGDKKVISIVIFFRAKYKIRRAMMEIMNKNFPETVLSAKNNIEQNRML